MSRTIELGPEGERTAPHPLLDAIGHRHTDRGPYKGGAIAEAALAALAGAARTDAVRIALFDAASPRGQRFGALTIEATAAIVADSAMMAASHAWFRHSRRDQDRLRDGLSVATSGVSPWLAAAAAILPEQSAASEGRYWLQGNAGQRGADGIELRADPGARSGRPARHAARRRGVATAAPASRRRWACRSSRSTSCPK